MWNLGIDLWIIGRKLFWMMLIIHNTLKKTRETNTLSKCSPQEPADQVDYQINNNKAKSKQLNQKWALSSIKINLLMNTQ